MSKRDPVEIAKLHLSDPDEDLFASPENGATTSSSSSSQKQQPIPKQSMQDIEDARDAKLRNELEKVRQVNSVIEGVTESLNKAKENMETVHRTVNNASTLLATWTRILSQTEHNQRLILNPNWQGATQDLEDMESDELRRQQDAERRAMEEQRRRDEAVRRAEEDERKRAAVEAKRGVTRTRSVRGTRATQLRSGVGGDSGRGRGTTGSSSTRGGSGLGRSSSVRGKGRGLG